MKTDNLSKPRSNRERLARLKNLLRVLDNTPDREFDLSTWADRESCRTTACLLGSAALDPYFKSKGLHLIGTKVTGKCGFVGRLSHIDERHVYDVILVNPKARFCNRALKQLYEGNSLPEGAYAGATVLGITRREANRLFIPSYYQSCAPSRANVRKRLRALINKYSAPSRRRAA